MNLFYAPPEQRDDDMLYLKDGEAHHATHVLRYKAGDPISVVDGKGGWFDGEIVRQSRGEVAVAIHKACRLAKKQDVKPRVLALGLIKNRQRLEFAVEKAVELGATDIILFQSHNSEREKVRVDRLELIAKTAMKQSLRAWLPGVRFAGSVSDLVSGHSDHHMLLAHEKHDGRVEVKDEWLKKERLMVLVGPEGGFSDEEVTLLTDAGAELVSLGSFRLRAETAAITLLARLIG